MKESVTYQAIVEEGFLKGEAIGAVRARRATLLRIGKTRFGAPSSHILMKLDAVESPDQLDSLIDRCLIVSNWDELVDGMTI